MNVKQCTSHNLKLQVFGDGNRTTWIFSLIILKNVVYLSKAYMLSCFYCMQNVI